MQRRTAGRLYLQDVLVRPQQELVLAQGECDILQLRQVAAAAIHCPQVVVGRVCQPCDVLQPTRTLFTVVLQVRPMPDLTAPYTSMSSL